MKLEFWLDYLSPLCYKQHQVIEQLYKKYTFEDLGLNMCFHNITS